MKINKIFSYYKSICKTECWPMSTWCWYYGEFIFWYIVCIVRYQLQTLTLRWLEHFLQFISFVQCLTIYCVVKTLNKSIIEYAQIQSLLKYRGMTLCKSYIHIILHFPDVAIHKFWPGLSDAVTPVLCLLVIVWIAVDVMQDDDISGGQVDTEPTCSGGQQEHKDVLVCVKLVDQHNPVVVDRGRGSWDASQCLHKRYMYFIWSIASGLTEDIK